MATPAMAHRRESELLLDRCPEEGPEAAAAQTEQADGDAAHSAAAVPGAKLRWLRAAGLIAVGLLATALLTSSASPTRSWQAASAMEDDVELTRLLVPKGGKPHHEAPKKLACSKDAANCTASQCCLTEGFQCYKKDHKWAACKATCEQGPNPQDITNESWSCEQLGHRAPGYAPPPSTWVAPWVAKYCSNMHENCTHSRCCNVTGLRCFEKDSKWAMCRTTCDKGPDPNDSDPRRWSCKPLGARTPGPPPKESLWVAPWVKKRCSAQGQNCIHTGCCKMRGMQCFRKNRGFATCKSGCTPGMDMTDKDGRPWTCETLGGRTPGPIPPVYKVVQPWVADKCKGPNEDCSDARCCKEPGAQCFQKNKKWSTCMTTCKPGKNRWDHNATWTCKQLGPRSWGLSLRGYPSLFCMSIMRPGSYEEGLIKGALGKTAGIFGCDGYLVLTQDKSIPLGVPPDGGPLRKKGKQIMSRKFPGAPVGTSVDGTAANSQLFINAWYEVAKNGQYRFHDWTVKADPDAVTVPSRLRMHMWKHTVPGARVYVRNCNKFPSSPNYPMMYGAVEVFSRLAINTFATNGWNCQKSLPVGAWGEDYFMGKCMGNVLGIGIVDEFSVLGDSRCTGANCADGYTAAFHEFKDYNMWMSCWNKAGR